MSESVAHVGLCYGLVAWARTLLYESGEGIVFVVVVSLSFSWLGLRQGVEGGGGALIWREIEWDLSWACKIHNPLAFSKACLFEAK